MRSSESILVRSVVGEEGGDFFDTTGEGGDFFDFFPRCFGVFGFILAMSMARW
jgi:hypothetical protein